MNKGVDERVYRDLLKDFYDKMVKNHPRRKELLTQSNKLLNSDRKNNYQLTPNSGRVSPAFKDTNSQMNSMRSMRTIKSKKSFTIDDGRSQRSCTSTLQNKFRKDKYFGCTWIYTSPCLKRLLSYATLFYCIDAGDIHTFHNFEQKINSELEARDVLPETEIRRATFEWSKIGQMMHRKQKIRWQKLLAESFAKFTTEFINLLFRILTGFEEIKEDNHHDVLHQFTQQLKLRLTYFQINNKNIISLDKFGEAETDMVIGKLIDDEQYVISNKIPEKSDEEVKKQNLNKKLSLTINMLLTEFQKNTQKLSSLELLRESTSKESKIAKYFSNLKTET